MLRPGTLRNAMRWGIAAALAWQAVVGAVRTVRSVRDDAAVDFARRFDDPSEVRLRRSLGEQSAVAAALRAVARPGEWALVRFEPVAGPELEPRIARLNLLRHAVFPTPWLVPAGAEPASAAEAALRPGQSVLLLVEGAEPPPADRAGWRCEHRAAAFQIWRLQRP